MCWLHHYKCACGCWTEYTPHVKGSEHEACFIAKTNPLRCNKWRPKFEKDDPRWINRDCPYCTEKKVKKLTAMKEMVKAKADALRLELGLPELGQGLKNRHSHMDVN